ncbi:hypothetical protein WS71_21580 [Burkholderia mayonis]|uniref:Uncharacterized protein n=1 Tax=Burkholderia mayonis TaxID=1385591 RepID=A0A1B4G1R8_9BURK|nr:hypothetical protein WS71_21580 [Burkholderia mayonis]KVE49379.1 hypothetical protein WS71_16645 [Burkholderia mayonis]
MTQCQSNAKRHAWRLPRIGCYPCLHDVRQACVAHARASAIGISAHQSHARRRSRDDTSRPVACLGVRFARISCAMRHAHVAAARPPPAHAFE